MPTRKKKFFTIPNVITLVRISLIPVLVYVFFRFYPEMAYLPASIYLFIALTDLLDGFIAKKFNMVSDVGKVLDPIADKLFLNTMLVCFAIKEGSPLITVLLIVNVIKELYVIIAGGVLFSRKFIMSSKFIGRAAAFVLNLGMIIWFFIPYMEQLKAVSDAFFICGLVLSLSAAVYYTIAVYKKTGGRLPPKVK